MNEIQQTDSVVLPIYDPMIKAYLHIGMPFSILPSRHIESGWVYQTYAQMVYHREDPEDAFLDFENSIFWEDEDVFTKGFIAFPVKNKNDKWKMLEGLKWLIKAGYYIYADWDEYYVPETPFYKRHFFRHYCLIYGYDKDHIYTEGYLEDGHWHRFQITQEEFVQALLENDDRDVKGVISVNTYRPRENFNKRFEWKKGKTEIQNYLYPKDEVHGRHAIRAFFDDVCSVIERGGEFPIQSVSIAYEHKIMMLERIRFLSEEKICSKEIADQYELIKKGFYTILCGCMKYKETGKTAWADRIKTKTEDLLITEKVILERMVNG